eukprot:CAMPEP_0172780278 /NCGR_PEP_ID=MMETSP1074-20121228/202846_1 /TAXON_ID=2916 /ORGANISM="Ceratium fusus, Strain PA161109" /LENGTH=216 /DNA_ID=CAMNT_0013617253 /DNA_START=127 /DNA_END=779 /DNA_ORIENTATION=-
MCGICLWRNCFHNDGHEAVEGAAKLRTLTIEHALALNESSDAVDAARCCICLDAQGGNGPTVKYILACDQEADVGTVGNVSLLSTDAQGGNGPTVKYILACDQEADVGTRWQRQPLVNLKVPHHARLQILIRHEIALELVICRDFCTIQIFLGGGVILCFHILQLWLLSPIMLGAEILQRPKLLSTSLATVRGGQKSDFKGPSIVNLVAVAAAAAA